MKTVIRAGYGIFHARFHGAALNTFFLTNGKYQANYSLTPTDGAAPVFPNILSSVAGSAGTISLEFADPKQACPGHQLLAKYLVARLGREVTPTQLLH